MKGVLKVTQHTGAASGMRLADNVKPNEYTDYGHYETVYTEPETEE